MLLRFGPYELNEANFELRRFNRRVRLATRPMELLLLLVTRRGELVTREEMARSLWPGVDVEDLESRINTAIAQIRAALLDDASKPRYLETVIGKGYRFTGAVETISSGQFASAGSGSIAAEHKRNSPNGLRNASTSKLATEEEEVLATQQPLLQPLPADTKFEAGTKSSGRWNNHRRWILLALCVLAGLALLATYPFIQAKLNPQSGGKMVATSITTNASDNPVRAAALSPDSRLLAYQDVTGVLVRDMQTGRTRVLKAPNVNATRLNWFSDQSSLLMTGLDIAHTHSGIWILSATGGDPLLFRNNAGNGAPSPDGRSIAFTVEDGREIRLAQADGADEHLIVPGSADRVLGALFWSADGKRISYQQRSPSPHGSIDIESNFEWSYLSRDIHSEQETARLSDLPFDSAQETADGRLVYLRSHPANDYAHNGIWTAPIDPATGKFTGAPDRLYNFGIDVASGLSVSADGKEIAAVKQDAWQADIYVAGLVYPSSTNMAPSLENVTRLTTDLRNDFPHSFSAAGNAIYFESNRVAEPYQIFRQQLGSQNAEMLTVGDEWHILPTLLPDGTTLVYEVLQNGKGGKRHKAIYRADANARDARLVWNEGELDQWRCPLLTGATCILSETSGHHEFIFYQLDLASGKGKELARCPWTPTLLGDWALSPDGTIAAMPNHDEQSPSIRLVQLTGRPGQREIKVHQSSQLWGINWSADQKGFYAESRTASAHRLQYISLSGDVYLLRQTAGNTWGIPSRDGRKLAFVDSSGSQNVYILR